jgi:hypothetical protein
LIRSLTTDRRLDSAGVMATTMTTEGDLITRDATTFAKLGIGSANTRLTSNGTTITWVADTQNTVVDAKGDLLAGTADNTIAKLSVSTNGTVLTANSSATTGLSWETPIDYTGLILALGG